MQKYREHYAHTRSKSQRSCTIVLISENFIAIPSPSADIPTSLCNTPLRCVLITGLLQKILDFEQIGQDRNTAL
ncbi:MAG: hypothetical protein LBK94_04005 [Prevotellaceae bacterium]|nr:hypothetical protein [Prevotellaceae bacterium]